MTVLFLPEDHDIRNKLGTKLNEYLCRVQEYRNFHPHDAPEVIGCLTNNYKARITERLLQDAAINLDVFADELSRSGPFREDRYRKAAGVIIDYCLTSGKHVKDGTGF